MFGILLSIAHVTLAFLQFREATSERINAEKAHQEAEVAKFAAEAAADAASEARQEAEDVRNVLREALLSVVKFVYLQVETRGDFGGERLAAPVRLERRYSCWILPHWSWA